MNIENDDDKELLLDTPVEEEGEEPKVEAPAPESDEEEFVFDLDLEGEEAEDDTPLVKQLRQQFRDSQRELSEYRKAAAPRVVDPGPKPTLESCEWDEEKFEQRLDAWKDATRKAENAHNEQIERQRVNNQEFERLQVKHRLRAEALRIPNFEEYEKKVVDALGPDMAGAALVLADDSAKLTAYLGKYPTLLDKIKNETNPLKQIKLIIQTEAKIMSHRKKPPEPEAGTITRSTASIVPQGEDAKAAKLLDKAQKTGNMDEYRAYMKEKRRKAA